MVKVACGDRSDDFAAIYDGLDQKARNAWGEMVEAGTADKPYTRELFVDNFILASFALGQLNQEDMPPDNIQRVAMLITGCMDSLITYGYGQISSNGKSGYPRIVKPGEEELYGNDTVFGRALTIIRSELSPHEGNIVPTDMAESQDSIPADADATPELLERLMPPAQNVQIESLLVEGKGREGEANSIAFFDGETELKDNSKARIVIMTGVGNPNPETDKDFASELAKLANYHLERGLQKNLSDLSLDGSDYDVKDYIYSAFDDANKALIKKYGDTYPDFKDMGTSTALAIAINNIVYTAVLGGMEIRLVSADGAYNWDQASETNSSFGDAVLGIKFGTSWKMASGKMGYKQQSGAGMDA